MRFMRAVCGPPKSAHALLIRVQEQVAVTIKRRQEHGAAGSMTVASAELATQVGETFPVVPYTSEHHLVVVRSLSDLSQVPVAGRVRLTAFAVAP